MIEKTNTPKFYKEVEVPEYWTLTDLLYWAAARVLPEPIYFEENEGREALDALIEYSLSLGTDLGPNYLTPEETNRLGIDTDPEWNYIQRSINGEDDILSSKHHKMMADLFMEKEYTEEEKASWEERREEELRLYKKALQIEEYKEKWSLHLLDALDETICSLIVKLKSGVIKAEGIEIEINPHGDFSEEVNEWLYAKEWPNGEFYSAHSPIPQNKWISRRVDWGGSYLRSGKKVYLAIRFDCDDVIQLFPPITDKLIKLSASGEYLFGTVETGTPSRSAKRTGRPSKNSDAIHRKIASIINQEGGLINKQDAFANEIKTWYEAEFGETIGLSTVKAKLSGYYKDPSFKKSEK